MGVKKLIPIFFRFYFIIYLIKTPTRTRTRTLASTNTHTHTRTRTRTHTHAHTQDVFKGEDSLQGARTATCGMSQKALDGKALDGMAPRHVGGDQQDPQ